MLRSFRSLWGLDKNRIRIKSKNEGVSTTNTPSLTSFYCKELLNQYALAIDNVDTFFQFT